jgi:hypothetical protein
MFLKGDSLNRRGFFQSLFGLPVLFVLVKTPARQRQDPRSILVQTSPVTGFQYCKGDLVWNRIAMGDPVRLVRETDNSHDDRAVKILWGDVVLGYVSQMLDQGTPCSAWISEKREGADPWDRLTVSIGLMT